MKFNLFILFNLATITSLGRSNPISQGHAIFDELEKCLSEFPGPLKQITNCSAPVPHPHYTEDILPYICHLSQNLLIDVCKIPNLLPKFNEFRNARDNDILCPFIYSKQINDTNMREAINYLADDTKCRAVCLESSQSDLEFKFLVYLNEVFKSYQEPKSVGSGASLFRLVNEKESKATNTLKKVEKVETEVHAPKKNSLPEPNIHRILPGTQIKINETKAKTSEPKVDDEVTTKVISSGTADLTKNDNGNKLNNNYNYNTDLKKNNEKQLNGKPENNGKYTQLNGIPDINISTEPDLPPDGISKDEAYDSPKSPGEEAEDDDNIDDKKEQPEFQSSTEEKRQDHKKISNTKELYTGENFFQTEDSHFSTYFLMTVSVIIIGYIIYHNKNKIVAYALEGRRNRNGRRRPASASYRKLDSNLEEAIASNPSHTSVTNVVY